MTACILIRRLKHDIDAGAREDGMLADSFSDAEHLCSVA